MSSDTTQTREETAAAAATMSLPPGLRYASDTRPGITRKRVDGAFVYVDAAGGRIVEPDELARINALAIPPAYEDVWICRDPRGHLQATGRDARGRKQYRYHPQWRVTRDAAKYERMAEFGRALPKIRLQAERDLKLAGIPYEKVVAAIVRLLDTTLVRIGSVEYARENRSFGLTTLRKRHLRKEAGRLYFRFTGKSGIEHDVAIDDPRISRVVRRCAELPGHDLFQYVADDGSRRTVGSSDINDYLRQASGAAFTAKDYRTWAGSVYALAALRHISCGSAAEARHHLVATVKQVATLLRNTPAVCRRCYIHPAIIDAFEAGELCDLAVHRARRGLSADEAAFIALLERATSPRASSAARAATRPSNAAHAERDKDSKRLTTLLMKSRAQRRQPAKPSVSTPQSAVPYRRKTRGDSRISARRTGRP